MFSLQPGKVENVSVETLRKFSWVLVYCEVFVLLLSCVCSVVQNANQASAQFMLVYVFLVILVWASSMSPQIVWPLRFVCYITPLGLFTSNFFSPWSYKTIVGLSIVAFGFVFGGLFFATPLYRVLYLAQRCMEAEYGDRILDVSMSVLAHLASTAPIIYYFVVYQMSGYVEVLFYNNEYVEYTPICRYIPGSYGVGNTEYKCEGR